MSRTMAAPPKVPIGPAPAPQLQAAVQAFASGDLVQAEKLARGLASQRPNDFQVLNLMGAICTRSGRWAEALGWLDRALAANGRAPETLNRHGNALQMLGHLDQALASYERALALRPGWAEAINNRGNTFKKKGRLDDALAAYDAAIASKPDYVEAHYNRGNALQALTRPAEALASYDNAIRLRPGVADYHVNRGNALQALKRHAEAADAYRAAIEIQPRHADAHANLGQSLVATGQAREALVSFDRALSLGADRVSILCQRGNAQAAAGEIDEALASFSAALEERPDHFPAMLDRGRVLLKEGRAEAALVTYAQGLQLDPDNVEILNARGAALHEMKRYDEALAAYDRALARRPDYVQALNNKGVTLHSLGRLEEALAVYDRVVALQPGHADAYSNRGNAWHAMAAHEKALADFDRAVELDPAHVRGITNRAVTMIAMRRHREAMDWFARARALAPHDADVLFNESIGRLGLGDYARGWPLYEYRWSFKGAPKQPRYREPAWTGAEDIAGRTILLYTEQGFGDALQFARYIPLVEARGARVVLEVEPGLQRLLARRFPGAIVIRRGQAPPPFDLQCALMSLAMVLGTTIETVPTPGPYLEPDPAQLSAWGRRLGARRGPRIGLAWSGSPRHANDRNRSCPWSALAPLLACDADFLLVQPGLEAGELPRLSAARHPRSFAPDLTDFTETAALFGHLDLLISVDTSVVHLAGALGLPVWLLGAQAMDWRWMLDRADTPWYRSVRIFRQAAWGDWPGLVGKVAAELARRPPETRN